MTAEHCSTILDVKAFFAVTLELYGRERVERLSERAHQVAKKARYGWSKSYIVLFSFWAAVLIFLVLVVVHFVNGIDEYPGWLVWRVACAIFASFLGAVGFGLIVMAGFSIVLTAIDIGTTCAAAIVRLRGLQGSLLIFGTALFVLARIVSW